VVGSLKTSGPDAVIINDHVIQAQHVDIVSNTASMTNNGTLEVSGDVKISNNGKIVNTNSIAAQSLTLDNGSFENSGSTTIRGETKATNQTVNIVNYSNFTTNTMSVSGSASVQNNCHLIVNDKLEITDARLFVNEGALLTTANLTMNNTRIELGSAAMMHVTSLATFEWNSGSYNQRGGDGFYGTGASKALLRMEKVVPKKIIRLILFIIRVIWK